MSLIISVSSFGMFSIPCGKHWRALFEAVSDYKHNKDAKRDGRVLRTLLSTFNFSKYLRSATSSGSNSRRLFYKSINFRFFESKLTVINFKSFPGIAKSNKRAAFWLI